MATATPVHVDPDELVRLAHEATYRFPEGFPGFRARLRFTSDRDAGEGMVVLRPGSPPELSIALSDEEERRWLERELASLASHRFHRPCAAGDGRLEKRLPPEDGHPLGRLVALEDELDSSYRIGGGLVNEITRTHGSSRFTIVIQGRAKAPGGRVVSTAFTVSFWDTASGRLVRSDAYTDEHVELDELLLPRLRRVATATDEGLVVRDIELAEHELLPAGGGR